MSTRREPQQLNDKERKEEGSGIMTVSIKSLDKPYVQYTQPHRHNSKTLFIINHLNHYEY